MVQAHSERIYRLALRMLGDPHQAEDVLQDTFLKAFGGLKDFEGRSSLGTWLHRIATNEALMRLRKREPDQVSMDAGFEGSDGEAMPHQLTDWCCLPEEEFMSAEAQLELDEAIARLSPALRVVFVLRDLQSFSTRETAEILAISEGAVKTRLLRARLQLREHLSEYFSERAKEVGHA